jgi:7-cyano-7-deazaguanine reductase
MIENTEHLIWRANNETKGGVMGRSKSELAGITLLGGAKKAGNVNKGAAVLETFINKHQDRDYWVTFTCPEFTSLCPVTGQPDFATITIQYIPGEKMVESKSLKIYLFGFRNRGDFHEDCVNVIMNDLCRAMEPKYIEVLGRFVPRGGIAIDPFVNYGQPGTKYAELATDRFRSYCGRR